MPKRTDIKSILIIGSGPIVIGQACEFDYSGTQACRALRTEGYRVILVNSNPATIMTDPDFADSTYIEPLTTEVLERIIIKEKPDVILPTLGGQTALNLAMELHRNGLLKKYSVDLIGASPKAIATAEDRQLFKEAMQQIGLAVAKSGTAHSISQAKRIIKEIGLPVIIRPAYILGGQGTGIAETHAEFEKIALNGLDASPINEILIEKSIKGWKEFELEVMRDHKDNCIIICSIENVDAMGVHTGDSITVAPAQTLTDVEYQKMRDSAFACLRRVGVETGGSNVQFAVNPQTGEQVIIEMNPRVSRSSALASKATGFPIAKIAALLAVGYTLDEIPNDITKKTPASFEPVIDYVVTKIPRWTFEKFPNTPEVLGTQMQSVGEVMAIGRTFPESLQKAVRSLELGRYGLNSDPKESSVEKLSTAKLLKAIQIPTPGRIFQVESLLRRGHSPAKLNRLCGYDPWFLYQIRRLSEARLYFSKLRFDNLKSQELKHMKQLGFSDVQLGYLLNQSTENIRAKRIKLGILPTYKTVDTCAAEFEADTPYCYSSWEDETETKRSKRQKVMILGSGPNRIGQGIEFDYTCVHASFALKEANVESIMYNCNPETVSTDYDTSDKLYFEPITLEDVLSVIDVEKPDGIIVSLGGQTPLKLANFLPQSLILGTSPASIDRAEDRDAWNQLCKSLYIPQPPGGTATNINQANKIASQVGFPVLIRPSYVLGGRAMRIVNNQSELKDAFQELAGDGALAREGGLSSERPVLLDHFLEDAIEVDLDALRDQTGAIAIAGIMEHVEHAGVHSGDSACALPTQNLSPQTIKKLNEYAHQIADELQVIGLINIQFAVQANQVFVIEANPRASRTIPFVAKAIGVPIAKIATRIMLGETLATLSKTYGFKINEQKIERAKKPKKLTAVKESVFAFNRFINADTVLGPEMKSTGEVMGLGNNFAEAFAKSQTASGLKIPSKGTIVITSADFAKAAILPVTRDLQGLGFKIVATKGTATFLQDNKIKINQTVPKVSENKNQNIVKLISSGKVELVINIPNTARHASSDGYQTRKAALENHIAIVTSVAAAKAVVQAIKEFRNKKQVVRSLQSQ
ncbi:MAG TPA: carbamoyl-phosphate synthase large subunit [Candidatus Saccharimonadales bacterium]|nr:carbamoyl-phosphate synthase large subunit [Candidatus Saccharimonadales bacterium]